MTHTLHRMGSVEDLSEDYVILVMPSKDINHVGSGPKLRRFLQMALDNGAIRIGDARLGNQYHQGGVNKVLENVEDRAVVHAVFKDTESLTKTLGALKEADLGLSVVVSGLFDEVEKCCKRVGLQKHTVNMSMGRWGRTEKLPPQEILEINTMCGHGMVTVGLIEEVVDDVNNKRCTVEEGTERLFRPCVCGIFNPHRAARLIREMTAQEGGIH
jgi:hypothetical protein